MHRLRGAGLSKKGKRQRMNDNIVKFGEKVRMIDIYNDYKKHCIKNNNEILTWAKFWLWLKNDIKVIKSMDGKFVVFKTLKECRNIFENKYNNGENLSWPNND